MKTTMSEPSTPPSPQTSPETAPASAHPDEPRPTRHRIIPKTTGPGGIVLGWIIHLVIRVVCLTLRKRTHWGPTTEKVLLERPVIFSIWHNRVAMALPAYNRVVRNKRPQRRLTSLVSASRDGALVARILPHFGAHVVRGSTSKRGAQAVLELTTRAKLGNDISITPDGPRGPCYQVQEGIVALSQWTGLPIVPVSSEFSRKWILKKSWDQFQIPMPFARWDLYLGEPLFVDRHIDDLKREELRIELQQRGLELVDPNELKSSPPPATSPSPSPEPQPDL